MAHHDTKSPPPVTYTPKMAVAGATLACTRCGRTYPYPQPDAKPIRCECGWRYANEAGAIIESFHPRLGV